MNLQVISILQVNLCIQYDPGQPNVFSSIVKKRLRSRNTHCKPNKLKVNNAILADSFRPLMEGVPTHLAACGILLLLECPHALV